MRASLLAFVLSLAAVPARAAQRHRASGRAHHKAALKAGPKVTLLGAGVCGFTLDLSSGTAKPGLEAWAVRGGSRRVKIEAVEGPEKKPFDCGTKFLRLPGKEPDALLVAGPKPKLCDYDGLVAIVGDAGEAQRASGGSESKTWVCVESGGKPAMAAIFGDETEVYDCTGGACREVFACGCGDDEAD